MTITSPVKTLIREDGNRKVIEPQSHTEHKRAVYRSLSVLVYFVPLWFEYIAGKIEKFDIKLLRKLNPAVVIITIVICLLEVSALADTEKPQPTEITRKQLKIAAYNSLWRLKRAIERDGFYGARVALNVWRSNAIEAGLFKQAEYDEYNTQIIEKSIDNSLKCIEIAIQNENYTDAKICLHTWKMRTQELGTFDQARYDEMKKQVEGVK